MFKFDKNENQPSAEKIQTLSDFEEIRRMIESFKILENDLL
jgi:hypothetical protein